MRWSRGSVGLLLALASVSAGLAVGCGGRVHGDGVVVQSNKACATCHLENYAAAVKPIHNPSYSTACADCHTTDAWTQCIHSPGAELAFVIRQPSKHSSIPCLECHQTKISFDFKANPDCTSANCHPRSWFDTQHSGGGTWSDTDHQFCRQCHPDGGGSAHNEQAFPIQSGKHMGIGCSDTNPNGVGYCHNTQLSSSYKANPDCTSICHPKSQFDSKHDPGCATWSSTDHQFCRNPNCHPTGHKPANGC